MLGRIVYQQVNVIVLTVHRDKLSGKVTTDLLEDGAESLQGIAVKYSSAVLGDEDQVDMHLENAMSTVSNVACNWHRPRVICP